MIFTGFHGNELEHFVNAQDNCSYCNSPLVSGPFVVWKFHHADIWLHRLCAITLANRLLDDASKIRELQK